MQEDKIGNTDHWLRGHFAEARADEKTPDRVRDSTLGALLNSPDQFMHSGGAQDIMMVVQSGHAEIGDIRLIIDLDQHIRVGALNEPLRDPVAGLKHHALGT